MLTPEPEERANWPDLGDGDVVVVIWPWNDGLQVLDTLARVIATTPAELALAIAGGTDLCASAAALAGEQGRRLRATSAAGLAGLVADACAEHPGADVVVVAGPGELPRTWFERLRAAARIDDAVAGATAITTYADRLFEIPGEPTPVESDMPAGDGVDHAGSVPQPRAYPRVLALRSQLSWIRRSALELAGPLDRSLSHPAAVLTDFAARATGHGLWCVLAPDVYVAGSHADTGPPPEHEREQLRARHPWLDAALTNQAALDLGPLRRSLVAARTARATPSVTIDARALGPAVGGTQSYIGALVVALAQTGRLRVRAVVAPDTHVDTIAALRAAGAETLPYEQAVAGAPRTDIVHRPQQVFTGSDLQLLRLLGDRLVVSQLDLIAYRNPTYHADIDLWQTHRRVTRIALAAADRVLFFSEHARSDAVAEDLVEPHRTSLAGVGIDPAVLLAGPAERPRRVPDDRAFMLVLGTDYTHKNRPFALALGDELRRHHGWQGLLVLAGPHVDNGSSADAERRLLDRTPELAARVVDLGRVSETERRWLLKHAQAHVCASNYEGFGLAPLEAASAGRPCIFAPLTSLAEIVDPAAATIIPWDPVASAAAAADLLRPGRPLDAHLELLSRALGRHTWDSVTQRLLDAYEAALDSPYPPARARAHEELQREELIVALDAHGRELDRRIEELRGRVQAGMPLIDARAPLLTPAEQRGLMRVAARSWLRRPVLGPFGMLGSISGGRRSVEPDDGEPTDAAP